MRHRPITPTSIADSRPHDTLRRSHPATTARLRREHARRLAWFNL